MCLIFLCEMAICQVIHRWHQLLHTTADCHGAPTAAGNWVCLYLLQLQLTRLALRFLDCVLMSLVSVSVSTDVSHMLSAWAAFLTEETEQRFFWGCKKQGRKWSQ